MTRPSGRRRTFGPVVVVGLAAAVLLAVSASKVWVAHDLTLGGRPAGVQLVGSDIGRLPLAGALSYLLLVVWGVLLVTRGVVRRGAAVLLALVALGLVACVVLGGFRLADDVRQVYLSQTRAGARLHTGFTGWYWCAVVTTVLSLACAVLAVWFVGQWPVMGRRYDAPAARAVPEARPEADPDDPEAGNLALWKAIDEGHDPTAPDDGRPPPGR